MVEVLQIKCSISNDLQANKSLELFAELQTIHHGWKSKCECMDGVKRVLVKRNKSIINSYVCHTKEFHPYPKKSLRLF